MQMQKTPIVKNYLHALERIKQECLMEGLHHFGTMTVPEDQKVRGVVQEIINQTGCYQGKRPSKIGIHFLQYNRDLLFAGMDKDTVAKVGVPKKDIVFIHDNYITFSTLVTFKTNSQYLICSKSPPPPGVKPQFYPHGQRLKVRADARKNLKQLQKESRFAVAVAPKTSTSVQPESLCIT